MTRFTVELSDDERLAIGVVVLHLAALADADHPAYVTARVALREILFAAEKAAARADAAGGTSPAP